MTIFLTRGSFSKFYLLLFFFVVIQNSTFCLYGRLFNVLFFKKKKKGYSNFVFERNSMLKWRSFANLYISYLIQHLLDKLHLDNSWNL